MAGATTATPPVGEVAGWVPLQPSLPLPPTAVQELEPVTVQLKCMVPEAVGVVGVAVKAWVNTGTPATVPLTVSVAVALTALLLPVQVRV